MFSSTPLSVRKQMDSTLGFNTNFKFFNKFHTRASELLMASKNRVAAPIVAKKTMFTNNLKAP